MDDFMKQPCKECPFRRDVKPFLHPDRATEIAYATQNRFGSFICHKTLEDGEDGESLEITEDSMECAGFLTLRAQCGEDIPEGFEPSWDLIYTDPYEMTDAYETEWDKKRKRK
jgi:hypothetical protein